MRFVLYEKAGTLVPSSHDDGAAVGSIVPLGALVQQLNCTLTWSKDDGLVINHPSYGKIAAQTIGNCPVISEAQALSLIAELEQAKVNELEGHVSDGQLRVLNWDLEELRSWEGAMATYVATGKRHHGLEALMMPSFPFGQIDESIRGLLVEDVDLSDQAGWNYLKAMPIRRAMRKRLFRTSWIVHLYAGPYDKKSDNLKVTERDGVTVLELDILRSSLFSLRGQSSAYKLLLWAALRGQIVSVVGGPPRDSESMELIYKQLFLWTAADKAMRMMRLPAPGFMMELPEGHGFWKSEVWSKWSHGLRMPSCYVSAGINEGQYKVATNLDFYKALPVERAASRDVPTWSPSSWTTTFKDQICDALQAWYKEPDLPRLVRMLAKFEGNYDEMSLADLKKWALHVRNGHVPFHPRCQTCVSTRATGRRHQRVRSPSSYVLSLDISGPYRVKGETGTRKDFRYVLVGAFMIPKIYKDLKEGDGEKRNEEGARDEANGTSMKEDFECSEYEPSEPGSVLKEGVVTDEVERDEVEGGIGDFGDYEDLFEEAKVSYDYVKDPLPEEELDKTNKEFWDVYKEVGDPPQMQVLQYAIPLVTRRSSEVNAAIRTMILKIKAEGFPVVRCHSDRARELTSDSLRAWLVERDILPTTGEGQAPQQNGRAEAVVKGLKGRHASGLPRQLWPMAMTYAAFAQRETAFNRQKSLLPFGTPTHIRTKVYGAGGKHDLELRWAKGRYVGPAQDIPRGSVVRLDEGGYVTSVHLRPHLVDADHLVDLVPHEVDLDFSESVRARTKEKTTPTTRAAPRLPPGAYPTGRISSLQMRPLTEEEEKAESLAKQLEEDKLYGVDNVLKLYEKLEASRQKSSRGGSSMWFTGAFVRGGKAGLRLGTTRMPWSTRYLIGAARHLTGYEDFTAVGVARNPKFGYHKDSHNEEEADNVVVGLNDVKTGGGLWVQNEDLHQAEADWRQVTKKVMCKGEVRALGRGDVTRFAPRLWHGAEPHEGDRYIMITYTPRTRALSREDKEVLGSLGFTSPALREGEQCAPTTTSASTGQLDSLTAEEGRGDEDFRVRSTPTTTSASGQLESLTAEEGRLYLIDEHSAGGPLYPDDEHSAGGLKPVPIWAQDFSSEDEVQQPKVCLLKSKQEAQIPELEGPLRAVIEDQEGLIEELSERAASLRRLLEEEEILAEQVRRAGESVHDEASHVRDLVEDMLDEVGKGLEHCQVQRELRCLKAIQAGEQTTEEPDYEALLEGLQRDLEVVYTVPLNQVKPVVERWRDAISAEVTGLFEGTLRSITIEEARQLEKQGRLKLVPSKSVCTLKPPSEPGSKKRYRRKYRLVICGNYIDRPDGASGESLYAGGASAESLRASLALAVIFAWTAGSSDIARAFLLAEWPAHMPLYGVFPPRLLLQTGHAKPGEIWLIQRPLYGLREAPAIWAAFRTDKLKAAKIDLEDGTWLALVQSVVDPEVWLVKQRSASDEAGILVGLLVTYVDDLLYLSKPWIVQKLHDWISSMWPTSVLAWATDTEGLRYLGVEVQQLKDGTFKLGQAGYVKDVLRGHGMLDAKPTFLPAPKEWLDEAAASERAPEEHSEAQLKHAQRVVGELMWLTMRTRPDLLFVTSFMASFATKLPLLVARVGARVHSYLAATKDVTLHVKNREAAQAATLLESIGVLLDEIAGARVHRLLRVDNSAAVSLLGAYQLADLATKVQTRARISDLMRLWGFDGYPAAPGYIECVKLALLLCILCAVPIATAVDPEEHVKKEALPASEWSELLVFTGVVCVITIGLWEIAKLERIRETAAVETERELQRVEGAFLGEGSSDFSPVESDATDIAYYVVPELGTTQAYDTGRIVGQTTELVSRLKMIFKIDHRCPMVFHQLVNHSALTDMWLSIVMMRLSPGVEAVEEEFVMTSTTSSPDRRGGRMRAQEEATWGFSRCGYSTSSTTKGVTTTDGEVFSYAARGPWRPPTQQRPHDAVSSSSSGHQEMVAEEVRRQVQGALQARDASMKALVEENEELKRMLVVQNRALEAQRETGRPMSRPSPPPFSHGGVVGTDGPDVGRIGNPGLERLGDCGRLGGLPENSQSGPLPGDGQDGAAGDQGYPCAPDGQLGPEGSGGGNTWGLPSEGVNAPSSTNRREGPPQTSATEPLQLLVQGMRQLQQAYLEKKDGPEQEVIKGGIELPKLPEPHADGGVEFQDWVYMTEQMVGSLTDKAGAWYMATLVCAKEAFARYQAATPLDRLNIAPILPGQLRAKLWERLDRRVLTLVLAAMPRQAKEDAVTHRVKTTADALFRLYVLYQPGSTTERAAVLKLLEGAPAGENPEEAVTALRRWRRHLNRAVDMGITPPDASLQLRGLDLIIAKVVERETVLQFYDHALAEIQQLAPLKGKSQGPSNTQGRSSAGCSPVSDIFYDFSGHSATDCVGLGFLYNAPAKHTVLNLGFYSSGSPLDYDLRPTYRNVAA
ncbi:RE1 [Symbiodinium necroappetens]|uniref:RE1 protein n=1 Tax=Symbiodinium necroappetens TaxID=1628268 RepID=A0A812S7I1_9DINO|nr:RE1 [Symbiodinium necroappetens]